MIGAIFWTQLKTTIGLSKSLCAGTFPVVAAVAVAAAIFGAR